MREKREESFDVYKKKGDEVYRKSIQERNPEKIEKFLDKASDFYKLARAHSVGKIDREKANNLLRGVKNDLLLRRGYLRRETLLGLFLASFLLSLFFLSPNLTGNIIGSISYSDSGILGIFFFICSLVCAFVYCRKKR